MKNLKKILALAIAFVMCFTMFAGALVFSDVPAGGDYSAAITLLSDLGVIAGKPDGSFGINDAISRADAACLIARLMTGEQNPPKYNNAPVFTDVVPGSYYESSVGYCAALGITSGTGNGQFSPSKTITDGEFVAMLTRALGYDTPEHPLQWPMGNIVVAQQKGLLKNVNIEYTSDALRGEDAQMLANALFADFDAAAARKNLYQRADDIDHNITIAEEVFNLGRLAYNDDLDASDYKNAVDFFGQEAKKVYNDGKTDYEVGFDCQAHTWVIAGVDAHAKENTYVAYAISDDDNKVVDPLGKEIRSSGDNWAYQLFTYTGDITPFIGYQVELWGDLDHPGKVNEVVAIRTIEGQKTYGYNASMDGGNDDVTVDDTKLKLKDADTGYATLELDKKNNWQTVVVDSSDAKNNRKEEFVYSLWKGHKKEGRQHVNGDELLNIKDGDQFTLYDWDADNDVDFVVKNTAKYAMVEDITSKRIVLNSIDKDGDDYRTTGRFGAKADKEDENTSKSLDLTADDLVINAEGVEKGDIVEITVDSRVYTKADEETVTITISKVDPEVKTLTKVSTKGDLASYFDGEEYKMANGGFWDLTEAKDPEDYAYNEQDLKREFDLFLDRNGFVVYSRYSNGDSAKYMMVMETQDGGGRISAHHLPQIKALLENDKVVTFDTIEKLKIYDTDGKTLLKGELPAYVAGKDAYDADTYKFGQSLVVGRVFRYYTNSRGEITKLVAAMDSATEDVSNNRNKTIATTNYSYDEKSMSLKDETPNGSRWNLEKAQAVFVVRNITENATHETYVRRTTKNNETYWYVDRDDVIAVSADDIPDINNKNDDTHNNVAKVPSACVLDGSSRSTTKDYNTWLTTERTGTATATAHKGADLRAILGYTGTNHDIKVALLGVNDFDGFGRKSAKLAILKDVDSEASETDGEKVYTFTMAMDGKEEAEYKSVSVEDIDDIVSEYNAVRGDVVDFKDDLDTLLDDRGLAYVEVRMDGDLVDEVTIMDDNDSGKVYVGQYYTVTRAVVGPEKVSKILQYNVESVKFSGEETFYEITKENASGQYVGLTTDTQYYKMGKRPTIAGKSGDAQYAGNELLVTNDFDDPKKVEAATVDEIDYSIIHNNIDKDDDYWVVDIATEKSSAEDRASMHREDAVAVLMFTDEMGENGVAGSLGHDSDDLNDDHSGKASYQIQPEGEGLVKITKDDGTPVNDLDDITISGPVVASLSDTANGVTAAIVDTKDAVKVTAAASAKTGVYTVTVRSKEYGWTSFTVIVSAKVIYDTEGTFPDAGEVKDVASEEDLLDTTTFEFEEMVNNNPGFKPSAVKQDGDKFVVTVAGTVGAGTGANYKGFGGDMTDSNGFIVAYQMPIPENAVSVVIKDEKGVTKGSGDLTTGEKARGSMDYVHYFYDDAKKVTRTFTYTLSEGEPVSVTYVLDASGVTRSAAVGDVDLSDVSAMDVDEIRKEIDKDEDFAGLSDAINTQNVKVDPVLNGNTLTLKTTGSYTLATKDGATFPGFDWEGSEETPNNGYIVVYKLAVPEGATKLKFHNGTSMIEKPVEEGSTTFNMIVYFDDGEQRLTRNYEWYKNDQVLAKMTYVYDVSGMTKN